MRWPWAKRPPKQPKQEDVIPELRQKVADRLRREHALRLELQRIGDELERHQK